MSLFVAFVFVEPASCQLFVMNLELLAWSRVVKIGKKEREVVEKLDEFNLNYEKQIKRNVNVQRRKKVDDILSTC